ncbi:MAG: glycosyltransferase family 2 protein, partial [Saprospiraceae bacterium]
MDHLKLSIITVTYNAEPFIESTLISVAEQTFTDYEHLIIDGASDDTTLEVVKKYERNQLRVFSEPDKGLYDAMNKAIQKAKGEYIIFLNAGDVFYDEGTLTQVFTKSNGEDFIYGNTVVVGKGGKTRPYHKKKPDQSVVSYRSFINGMVICHQSMIVRR